MAQYIKTEEGYKKFASVTDNKMDKIDPVGTGSFSMNRKAGTVIGTNSHAEGDDTTASGAYSHAEGSSTQASGSDSHAEGYQTTASGGHSHAEGYSTSAFLSAVTTTNPTSQDIITAWKSKKFSVAKGNYSHVEGKDNLALKNYSHAEGNETIADGPSSHAEGYQTIASGQSSHAEGNYTYASGNYSHAEGGSTKASGNYSHTEGNGTRASGLCSHAEGGSTNQFSSVVTTTNPTTDDIITAWNTKKFSLANDNYSHVEGKDNLALGDSSHAEGNETKARGFASHAEGFSTTASGKVSHAEGNYSTASGFSSHAEGSYTKASGDQSHVQGKFNIEDTSNTYADIIGNGTSDTARSNAATVDWNGNAWFAGDVYTGSTSGTNKDEGSKKLATEEYVNSSIAAGGTDISLGLTSAAVGQIIKVKAIDASGKPTAWEAANMPSVVTDEHINSLIDAKLRTFQAP